MCLPSWEGQQITVSMTPVSAFMIITQQYQWEKKGDALVYTILFLNPLSTFWGTRVKPIFMLNELLRNCYSNSNVHVWQHKYLLATCYLTGDVSCVCTVKLHSSSYNCLFRSMEWVLLIIFWPCLIVLSLIDRYILHILFLANISLLTSHLSTMFSSFQSSYFLA